MNDATRFDAIIVGGGVIGSSTAYHLLKAAPDLDVVVIERDPTYARASSALSVGNARVQFSLRQNIQISQYTFEILQRFPEAMAVGDDQPDVGFRREGNLFMVSDDMRSIAARSMSLQRNLACDVEWLPREEIRKRFPLYDIGNLVGATFGAGDGHLDGYAFLMGFRNKAVSMGARLMRAEVTRIAAARGRVNGVELASGDSLAAGLVVNCAGAWAAELAGTAGVELPVLPVQRQVFIVEPAVKPRSRLPLTSLPSGLYFRSEGDDRLLVGKSLTADRVGFDFRWEEKRFTEILWPELSQFVPAFDRLRFDRGWAGLYAVNTFDGNAILGEWPGLRGLYLANGFSGHGLQQAPAVGRYLAELITDEAPTLDLSIFGAERILDQRPVHETALV